MTCTVNATATATATDDDASASASVLNTTTIIANSNMDKEDNSLSQRRPLRVVFLHLDWGIGGAEQLMLQLATASVTIGHSIQLVTTRCDPDHCFASLKPGSGPLHPFLKIYASRLIPPDLGGSCRAVFSTLRLLYSSYQLYAQQKQHEPSPDVIVLDVLPTPIPLLQWLFPEASVLFYCHFPDQLLATRKKGLYRQLMDGIENWTLPFSDLIVVNSKFTQKAVQETFTTLQHTERHKGDDGIPVLYPSLDTTALDNSSNNNSNNNENKHVEFPWGDNIKPLVSLNRYERKKQLELFLEAALWIQNNHPTVSLPPLVIAGGYDVACVANVEYRGELQNYVDKHMSLKEKVYFLQSISDAQRTQLLKSALAVVYTPSQEHFGIVPVEAMYCETPVVACHSGGPVETIQHGETGFLCQPNDAESFGRALLQLVQDPVLAETMGKQARQHTLQTLANPARFTRQWNDLVWATVQRGRQRQVRNYYTYQVLTVLTTVLDAMLTFAVIFIVTFLLQRAGIIHNTESIWGFFKRLFFAGSSNHQTLIPWNDEETTEL